MVSRSEITWQVAVELNVVCKQIREQLGAELYKADRDALQEFLCQYFSTHERCDRKLGRSISPIAGGSRGVKRLKVRDLPKVIAEEGHSLVVVPLDQIIGEVMAKALPMMEEN